MHWGYAAHVVRMLQSLIPRLPDTTARSSSPTRPILVRAIRGTRTTLTTILGLRAPQIFRPFLTGLGVTGTIDSVSSMSVGSLTGHTVSVTGTGANIFAIHFGSNELIFEFSALLTSFQLTLGCPQGHSNCEGKHNLSNIIAFDNIPTIPTSGSGDPLATPLPAALPLFASGGALLGFIGWRRKRKAIT